MQYKILHILKEYQRVKRVCGMFGGKSMPFYKYFFLKWKEMTHETNSK